MKWIKSFLCVTLLILFLISVCGCTLIWGKLTLDTKDTNGEDDFSLAVFGDKEICEENNKSYCAVYGFNPTGESSDPNEEIRHDADTTEASALSPFSGVAVLQVTYGKEDTVIFTVECERSQGNLRIVLLDENFHIIHDFDVSETSDYTVIDAKDKTFQIRVAGESAKFEIKVSREFVSS